MSAKVATKMVKVMAAIGGVGKDTKHTLNYKFHSVEAVNAAVREHMIDHNLMLIPSCISAEQVEGHWLCRYKMTFVDGDSGEVLEADWQAAAPYLLERKGGETYLDDKALGKAHSYAVKYFLLRTFMVTSEDDVDLDKNSGQYQRGGRNSQPSKPAPQQGDKPKAEAPPKADPETPPIISKPFADAGAKKKLLDWCAKNAVSKMSLLSAMGLNTEGDIDYWEGSKSDLFDYLKAMVGA